MTISEKVNAYHAKISGAIPWRYRSWEHCHTYFRGVGPSGINDHREQAALQLAFYLASWGMYRGSGFLLQYDFTIHFGVIDCLADASARRLWGIDIGSSDEHAEYAPQIVQLAESIRQSYAPFGRPSDILVTKILLGTLGCVPACDRFFVAGFKAAGYGFSYFNERFVRRVLEFCGENRPEITAEQSRILQATGVHYPLMKLVDMCFWQVGFEASPESERFS